MSMRTTDRRVAIGTFEFREKADAAVNALEEAGFLPSEIGVIAKRTSQWDDLELPREEANEMAAENAASGAVAGAAAGAGVGGLWALGIAAGLLPAIGPVVAGGLLGSLLASAAAGAAAGGLGGALLGLGMSEDEVTFYSSELHAGRIVVTVNAGDRYPEAVQILRVYGATLTEPMKTNKVVVSA